MPLPDNPLSNLDRVSIVSFQGMDASRSPTSNEEYGIGQLAVNLGRNQRQPLHARNGLQPVTSANGNHVFAGQIFAMGALQQGNRMSMILRLSGGRLVAATNCQLVTEE